MELNPKPTVKPDRTPEILSDAALGRILADLEKLSEPDAADWWKGGR